MYDFNKVTEITRSLLEVEVVFTAFKSIIPLKCGKSGQKFYLDHSNKRMCFILFKGVCIVNRSNDSLVLSTIKAPAIVGVQDVFHEKSDAQVSAISDIEYVLMEVDEMFSYADKHDLWKSICYVLMLSATRFSEYQKETVGVSNYELMCNFLRSLSRESFEVRATTTALDYIQGRSRLSRSGIMKTLASLKAGGYIMIKNGLLIEIKTLPKKF